MGASALDGTLRQVVCGEHAGSATAHQLDDLPCRMVYLQAKADNAGNVYVGAAGVTVPDGTGDATSGFKLAAGDTLGPLPLDNLSRLYIICDNAGDDISYLLIG